MGRDVSIQLIETGVTQLRRGCLEDDVPENVGEGEAAAVQVMKDGLSIEQPTAFPVCDDNVVRRMIDEMRLADRAAYRPGFGADLKQPAARSIDNRIALFGRFRDGNITFEDIDSEI
ncbi:hypothetical protein BK022_03630 [Methylorubrum extorquens]|uniref:Uncharacterized protein n=1 Tax=Methylorubrum extorquens TaxID=408 RepID=A0A1S1P420_METEX|nr:hypothetical protein BK022_03630 [Methylorubrum extorquens]